MSGVCCLVYIRMVTVTAAVVALGGKAFALTHSPGPLGTGRIHVTHGGINREDPPCPPGERLWPCCHHVSLTYIHADLYQGQVERLSLLSPLNWQHPFAGEFKHSHSGCYFLWLLWPPRPRSLFLDLQKCQDDQISVTGSLGPWNNSWGVCNSKCLKGSAFTEPPWEEWTANPLIQWNLFLMLGEPRGQGEATVTTLTRTPFSTLQTILLRLHQPSFHNDERPPLGNLPKSYHIPCSFLDSLSIRFLRALGGPKTVELTERHLGQKIFFPPLICHNFLELSKFQMICFIVSFVLFISISPRDLDLRCPIW